MDLGLEGRTILIAGSSRGIGLAVARAFLAEGARVAISGRDGMALERARAELAARFGDKQLLAVHGDMTDEAAISAALDQTEARLGPLYAAIANVGNGSGPAGHRIGTGAWDAMLTTNLLGAVRLAGMALDRLVAQRDGNLVLISSIAGLEAIGAPVPYAVAKSGLLAAMKSYARQVGGDNVRVNAVAPGNVLFPDGTWARKLAEQPERVQRMLEAEVALRRFGTPEEIADAVLFLASPRAAFITGSVLVADGGQTRGW